MIASTTLVTAQTLRAQAQRLLAQLPTALRLPVGGEGPGPQARRHRSGTSRHFREHRAFVPGDDLRHLDWRAFARRGRPMLKTYEEEGQPRWLIALERSPSMLYAAESLSKWASATAFAFAAASALLAHGAAVGFIGLPSGPALAAAAGRLQRERVLAALLAAAPIPLADSEPLAGAALELGVVPALVAANRRIRPSCVLAIGDWLSPELLRSVLMISPHVAKWVVHVQHPNERRFPYTGPHRFAGSLQAPSEVTDAAQSRDGYLRRWASHEITIEQICKTANAQLCKAGEFDLSAGSLRRVFSARS